MWVESKPSLMAARVMSIAAVWRTVAAGAGELEADVLRIEVRRERVANRSGRSVVVPQRGQRPFGIEGGRRDRAGRRGSPSRPSSPRAGTPAPSVPDPASAASGSRSRWIGHSERTSINANPAPSTWSWRAFLIARLACVRRRLS